MEWQGLNRNSVTVNASPPSKICDWIGCRSHKMQKMWCLVHDGNSRGQEDFRDPDSLPSDHKGLPILPNEQFK